MTRQDGFVTRKAVFAQGPFADLLGGGAGASPTAAATAAAAATAVGSGAVAGVVASASASLPDAPPSNAIDGDPGTIRSAGAGPEQWIQLDLGAERMLGGVRLAVAQTPAGATTHRMLAGSTESDLAVVHEFQGTTTDGQELSWAPSPALPNIRILRVLTVESSSWIAWREIEVVVVP